MPIFLNFWPCADPGRALGHHEAGLAPADPSSGSTDSTNTCVFAMPPFVIQVLVPLSTHSSLASS